jgi:hypothetical protein
LVLDVGKEIHREAPGSVAPNLKKFKNSIPRSVTPDRKKKIINWVIHREAPGSVKKK